MLVAAGAVAEFLTGTVGSDFARRSLLVQQAGATLAAAEAQVAAIAAVLPIDLRHALAALAQESKILSDLHAGVLPPVSAPVPEDVEKQARIMILAGNAPPAEWTPFIRHLDFAFETLEDLEPLAGLSGLQSLYLDGTPASDVAPLAGLSGLQSLDLDGTPVSDVAPLAGLTSLQSLDLRNTQVSDVAPLSKLHKLRIKYLYGSHVTFIPKTMSRHQRQKRLRIVRKQED